MYNLLYWNEKRLHFLDSASIFIENDICRDVDIPLIQEFVSELIMKQNVTNYKILFIFCVMLVCKKPGIHPKVSAQRARISKGLSYPGSTHSADNLIKIPG